MTLRRRTNVSFRPHIVQDVSDHAQNHHNIATGTSMRLTYLRRLCDVQLVRAN